MKLLTQTQLNTFSKKLSNWTLNKQQTKITCTHTLPDFVSALAFCAKVGVHAEIAGHHPILEINHAKVKLTLTTNDSGGLTKLDIDLAKKIDILIR